MSSRLAASPRRWTLYQDLLPPLRAVVAQEPVPGRIAFILLLRAEAEERLRPSLRGSGVSLFLPSRPVPGSGHGGPPNQRRCPLAPFSFPPIPGCPLLSGLSLALRPAPQSVGLVILPS